MNASESQAFDRRPARRIIGHLREGVAPDDGLDLLTVGRERWVQSIREDLELADEAEARRVRFFNGRYGDGKTHLLKLTSLIAQQSNFVVTLFTISKDLPLNRWDRLYPAIVRGLHTRSRPDRLGLCAILDPDNPDPDINAFVGKAEELRQAVPNLDPDFATAIYKYTTKQGVSAGSIDEKQDLLTLQGFLEGHKIARTVLRDYAISGPVERHSAPAMLKSMAACLRYFGYAGLVILIDEVESVLDQSKTARAESYENLRLFIDRDKIPPSSLVVCSTTPEMFSDAERGFQSYPALWSRIQPPSSSPLVNYRATVVDLAATPLKPAISLRLDRRFDSSTLRRKPGTQRVFRMPTFMRLATSRRAVN